MSALLQILFYFGYAVFCIYSIISWIYVMDQLNYLDIIVYVTLLKPTEMNNFIVKTWVPTNLQSIFCLGCFQIWIFINWTVFDLLADLLSHCIFRLLWVLLLTLLILVNLHMKFLKRFVNVLCDLLMTTNIFGHSIILCSKCLLLIHE